MQDHHLIFFLEENSKSQHKIFMEKIQIWNNRGNIHMTESILTLVGKLQTTTDT